MHRYRNLSDARTASTGMQRNTNATIPIRTCSIDPASRIGSAPTGKDGEI